MDGGTFTISNGGVFGSLMGTPIINPPQSAILGMHGIFDRPVAVKGEVSYGSDASISLAFHASQQTDEWLLSDSLKRCALFAIIIQMTLICSCQCHSSCAPTRDCCLA